VVRAGLVAHRAKPGVTVWFTDASVALALSVSPANGSGGVPNYVGPTRTVYVLTLSQLSGGLVIESK